MMSKGVMVMNRLHTVTIAMATSALLLTGCTHPNGTANNTANGALIGAGSGAAFGAALGAIGGGGRGAAAGAILGGGLGAITGTIIGSQIDQQQKEELQEEYPATYAHVQQNQPLTVSDVEALAHAKVSDDVIISQIQTSHSVYHLSATDIIDLRNAGVSDRVVNIMIGTVNQPVPPPSPTVVSTDTKPPPPPAQPVVVAPAPGYVWVGGEWQWNGVAWVWTGGSWVYPPWPGAIWVHGYWFRGPFGGWRHAGGHWR
jgi:hypothetical protein